MKLTVTTFLTLDGVIQGPGVPDEDRSDGFEHGGWQVPYWGDDIGAIITDWFSRADAFLLGRKTYEIFAAHWPRVSGEHEHDPIATKLNSLPKYVATRTLTRLEWNNSRPLEGDVAEAVGELKRRPGQELQVHGSADLVQTLMRHDLVDEYRLWFFPVMLGTGKRLFAGGTVPSALKLLDARTTRTGAALHVYEPAGKPVYGSFALDQ